MSDKIKNEQVRLSHDDKQIINQIEYLLIFFCLINVFFIFYAIVFRPYIQFHK